MKISDLRKVTPEEFGSTDGRVELKSVFGIPPYVVYLILREWVGEPTFKPSDSRTQWEYLIFTPNLKLMVYDWKLDTVSIAVYGRTSIESALLSKEADAFIDLVRKQKSKHWGTYKTARTLAVGYVIRNPFWMYFSMAESLYGRAIESKEEKESAFIDPHELYAAAFLLYEASLEGLLHLIYEIYLTPELRFPEFFGRMRREQIEFKIRTAPVFCTCFRAKTDLTKSNAFQKFKAITEFRNMSIHANITDTMKSPILIEEGMEFWLWDPGESKFDLPGDIKLLSAADVEFARESVWEFASEIIHAMQPKYGMVLSRQHDHELLRIDKVGDKLELFDTATPSAKSRRKPKAKPHKAHK